MTPTAPELLAACAAALATPLQPEDMGVFVAARVRTVALLNVLVAQECAEGTAARVWENRALRALLGQASDRYGAEFGEAAATGDGDFSLAALDSANEKLRRALIRLHEKAESSGDRQLDRAILKLYREMARRRELRLTPAKAV